MRSAVNVLVLAFISLLTAALFVTALVQLRGAAARMQCSSTLKQIGLALECYHDTYDAFPAAGKPNPLLPPEKRLSWIVILGPYFESDNLYSRLNGEGSWDAEENRFLALIDYRYATCPNRLPHHLTSTLPPSCYVGISGLGEDAIELDWTDARSGFFGYERTLKSSMIENGSSSLLAVTETTRTAGSWTAAGPPTVRGLVAETFPPIHPQGQFGGYHQGGANALFADGSVRFLRGTLAPGAIQAMATLEGCQDVPPFPGGS